MSLSTRPRRHADPEFLSRKQARWSEPHVAPLNGFADQIAQATGSTVPYLDPDSGGVDARVLLLLEAPSRAAAHVSGMVSADNDDATAANLWRAYAETGLRRERSLIWNAVPWYLGEADRIASARSGDLIAARTWLADFVGLLSELRVIVALGRAAQRAVAIQAPTLTGRAIGVLAAPHPSQRVYNRPAGRAREQVHAALRAAGH